MKTALLEDGSRFIGEVLAGSGNTINGMYVEYSDEDVQSVDGRTHEYYDNLLRSRGSGYGRVAVKNVECDKDGVVHVSCVVTSSDLHGGKLNKNSKLVAATLVSMQNDSPADDRLLYASLLSCPVKVVKGVYNYIEITFSIG